MLPPVFLCRRNARKHVEKQRLQTERPYRGRENSPHPSISKPDGQACAQERAGEHCDPEYAAEAVVDQMAGHENNRRDGG